MFKRIKYAFARAFGSAKYAWKLIKYNGKTVARFMLFYNVLSMFAFATIFTVLFQLTLKMAGVPAVTPDTFLTWMLSGTTVVCAILLLLLFAGITLFEMSGLIYIYHMSRQRKKASLSVAIRSGFDTCRRLLYPRNWIMIVYLTIFLPFAGNITLANSGLVIAVPEFIQDYIFSDGFLILGYTLIRFGLLCLSMIWIYAIFFFVLRGEDFIKSCRSSWRIIKHSFKRTMMTFLIVSVVFDLICLFISAVAAGLVIVGMEEFDIGDPAPYLGTIIRAVFLLNKLISYLVYPAVNIATLSSLFYWHRIEYDQVEEYPIEYDPKKGTTKAQNFIIAGIILALVVTNVTTYGKETRNLFYGKIERPQILAHRGDSVRAPENSVAAFQLAVEEGADWIELDVHQTKDRVLIVSHDDDLERISGEKILVHESNYDDIKDLDVGSWFSDAYSYLRLPTLEEVLAMVEPSGIKVQIEIKPTGFDDHIEEQVIEAMEKTGMKDRCLVISLQSGPLRRMVELDPDAHVAYCMAVGGGDLTCFDFTNTVSVEESNVTERNVIDVHENGGQFFVWTVNEEDNVQYLVDCGVDGILTDDPVMMKETLDGADYSGGLMKFVRMYMLNQQ